MNRQKKLSDTNLYVILIIIINIITIIVNMIIIITIAMPFGDVLVLMFVSHFRLQVLTYTPLPSREVSPSQEVEVARGYTITSMKGIAVAALMGRETPYSL